MTHTFPLYRFLLLTCFFLTISFALSFSQDSDITTDSLEARLESMPEDTQRVKTLISLSRHYMGRDWGKFIVISDEILRLSKTLSYASGMITGYNKRGIGYAVTGNLDSAVYCQHRCIAISIEEENTKGEAAGYGGLGATYTNAGMMDSALKYSNAGLTLAENEKDTFAIYQTSSTIGSILISDGKYAKALDAFLRSMRIDIARGGNGLKVINNLGKCYLELGQFEKAKSYFDKAVEVGEEIGVENVVGWACLNLGDLHNRDSHSPYYSIPKTEYNYKKAIAIFRKMGASFDMAVTMMYLGDVYRSEGRYIEAESHLSQSVAIFRELNQIDNVIYIEGQLARLKLHTGETRKAEELISNTLNNKAFFEGNASALQNFYASLAQDYSDMGNFEKAFYYERKNKELGDSLMSFSRDAEFAAMAEQYESEKREATISLLEENDVLKSRQIQTQKSYLLAVGIGALALAGLAFLLFRNAQKRKATNLLLSQKNIEIEKQNEQKAILLKEIHHRVKNNLQIISSLLKLQSKEVEDDAALEALNEGRNRVWSMALIHQRLYQRDELGSIDLQDYIEELVENLSRSFSKKDKEIAIETNLQPVEVDVDTAIPIGLILNELVTNAYKYAFQNKKEGKIKLGLNLSPNKTLSLTVADNGVGMESGSMEKSQSFGMKLVKSLSKKLRAELDILNENGTQVVLSIPEFSGAQPVFEGR